MFAPTKKRRKPGADAAPVIVAPLPTTLMPLTSDGRPFGPYQSLSSVRLPQRTRKAPVKPRRRDKARRAAKLRSGQPQSQSNTAAAVQDWWRAPRGSPLKGS